MPVAPGSVKPESLALSSQSLGTSYAVARSMQLLQVAPGGDVEWGTSFVALEIHMGDNGAFRVFLQHGRLRHLPTPAKLTEQCYAVSR